MTLQEATEKLKTLLFKDEVKAELKFETAKLNDGVTEVEWENDLVVGTIVYVLDSNGSKLPLPVGDYQLEDGTTFVIVDDMGTADKIVKAEEAPKADTPAVEGDAPVAQSAEPVQAVAPKRVIKSQVEEHVFSLEIEGVEPIVVDFSPMFAKVIAENETLKVELSKAKELTSKIEEVVNAIADEPAKVATEQKFNKVEKKLTAKELTAYFRASLK